MKRMLKIFLLLIIMIVFLAYNDIAQAKSTSRVFIGETTKYSNSNTVTVNIYMEGVDTEITVLGLNVEYDISKLQFISSKSGKDLHATVKLAKNMPEDGKVVIAALAVNGFQRDGLYYSITFKIIDDSEDIPIRISKREVTDEAGNDKNIETIDGMIKISKETTTIKRSPENQKIENFEVSGQTEYDNLDTYLQEQGKIDVVGNDILVYEVEDSNVIEMQDDGTIIPVKDGMTNVRVKLNNNTIGNVAIKIENGVIQNIVATNDNLKFKASSSTQDSELLTLNDKEEKAIVNKGNHKKSNKKYAIVFLLIILFIFVLFIMFRFKRHRSESI